MKIVLYSEEMREEAVAQANLLRSEGIRVNIVDARFQHMVPEGFDLIRLDQPENAGASQDVGRAFDLDRDALAIAYKRRTNKDPDPSWTNQELFEELETLPEEEGE